MSLEVEGKMPDQFTGTLSDGSAAQSKGRSRRRLWWLVGSGLLVVLLVVGAAIALPRILHAQRVAAYTDVVAQTNSVLAETHTLRAETDLATVLYSLQLAEAREFQPVVAELADYSDHYFSEGNLAALEQVSEALKEALEDDEISESEAELIAFAENEIALNGYVWQTAFLNLVPGDMEQLIERSDQAAVVPVPDEEVTAVVLDEAKLALASAETMLTEAQAGFSAAEDRGQALTALVVSTFEPLQNSALESPDQAEVVAAMYPAADPGILQTLRDSARLAAESNSAELFTVDDEYNPVPLTGEATDDQVSFAVTDAWRSVIIATHLQNYSGAVTAAWISDAGGLQEALGFNPFLPFV